MHLRHNDYSIRISKKTTLFLTFFLVCLFLSFLFATSIMMGGQVPVINSVSSIGELSLDISQGGFNSQIASFYISNNTPSFILNITFVNGGKFINKEIDLEVPINSILITESGNGILGQGIIPLINKEMLPLVNNEFIWKSENQKTATINYGLKIMANWNAQNLLSGLYSEIIITSIQAVF